MLFSCLQDVSGWITQNFQTLSENRVHKNTVFDHLFPFWKNYVLYIVVEMFIDRFEIKMLKIRKAEGHSHEEDTLTLAKFEQILHILDLIV